MKIGIDAQCLIGKKTGIGHYTDNLTRVLEKSDGDNNYALVLFQFFLKQFRPPIVLTSSNFQYALVRILPGRVFSKLLKWNLLPPLDLFLGKKVYWFPNFVSWPLLYSKSVLTVADLSYVLHGEYTQEANRRFLTKFVPGSIERASAIITISENSKKEIIDYYKVDPTKITIVHPAVDHDFFKPASDEDVARMRQKYGLPGKYVLYVGTLEPRKNIVRLIEAYAALPREIKTSCPLVLGGGKGWKDDEIGRKIEQLKASGEQILATGYLDKEDLPTLYSGASVFVFPSHYEGFGMPPLEAMACGTPVVTSDNSSLPEVVGKAGILVNAESTPQITEAMIRVLTDPQLADKMRRQSLKQAQKFNWPSSARRLLEVLERVGDR